MSVHLQSTVETIYKQGIEAAFGRGMHRLVLRAELNTIVHYKSSDFLAGGMGKQEGRKKVLYMCCHVIYSTKTILFFIDWLLLKDTVRLCRACLVMVLM